MTPLRNYRIKYKAYEGYYIEQEYRGSWSGRREWRPRQARDIYGYTAPLYFRDEDRAIAALTKLREEEAKEASFIRNV